MTKHTDPKPAAEAVPIATAEQVDAWFAAGLLGPHQHDQLRVVDTADDQLAVDTAAA